MHFRPDSQDKKQITKMTSFEFPGHVIRAVVRVLSLGLNAQVGPFMWVMSVSETEEEAGVTGTIISVDKLTAATSFHLPGQHDLRCATLGIATSLIA